MAHLPCSQMDAPPHCLHVLRCLRAGRKGMEGMAVCECAREVAECGAPAVLAEASVVPPVPAAADGNVRVVLRACWQQRATIAFSQKQTMRLLGSLDLRPCRLCRVSAQWN